MRAFIAIDLPDEVRQALGKAQRDFQADLARAGGVKASQDLNTHWTRPEGIHLTLKFLGEISDHQVKLVSEALAALDSFKSFSIEVTGFGFFPGPSRPRVFWAGVAAPPDLAQLAQRIESSMENLGFAREQRDFNPHLTLARLKDPRPNPAFRSMVERRGDTSFGSFEISEFFLFESKLSPHGAEYRKVARFPL